MTPSLDFLSDSFIPYKHKGRLQIDALANDNPELFAQCFNKICEHLYSSFQIQKKECVEEVRHIDRKVKPIVLKFIAKLNEDLSPMKGEHTLPAEDFALLIDEIDIEDELKKFASSPYIPLVHQMFIKLSQLKEKGLLSPGLFLYSFCHYPTRVFSDEEGFQKAIADFEEGFSDSSVKLAHKIHDLFVRQYPFFFLRLPGTVQFQKNRIVDGEIEPTMSFTPQLKLLEVSRWARRALGGGEEIPSHIDMVPDGSGFIIRIESEAVAKALADFCNMKRISWKHKLTNQEVELLFQHARDLEIDDLCAICCPLLNAQREDKSFQIGWSDEGLEVILVTDSKEGCRLFTEAKTVTLAPDEKPNELLFALADRAQDKGWKGVKTLNFQRCPSFSAANVQTLVWLFPDVTTLLLGSDHDTLSIKRMLAGFTNRKLQAVFQ